MIGFNGALFFPASNLNHSFISAHLFLVSSPSLLTSFNPYSSPANYETFLWDANESGRQSEVQKQSKRPLATLDSARGDSAVLPSPWASLNLNLSGSGPALPPRRSMAASNRCRGSESSPLDRERVSRDPRISQGRRID